MKKIRISPIPEGFTADDVKIEASICNGEKRIGFYDKHDKKLHYDELIKSDGDIKRFYEKYSIRK